MILIIHCKKVLLAKYQYGGEKIAADNIGQYCG